MVRQKKSKGFRITGLHLALALLIIINLAGLATQMSFVMEEQVKQGDDVTIHVWSTCLHPDSDPGNTGYDTHCSELGSLIMLKGPADYTVDLVHWYDIKYNWNAPKKYVTFNVPSDAPVGHYDLHIATYTSNDPDTYELKVHGGDLGIYVVEGDASHFCVYQDSIFYPNDILCWDSNLRECQLDGTWRSSSHCVYGCAGLTSGCASDEPPQTYYYWKIDGDTCVKVSSTSDTAPSGHYNTQIECEDNIANIPGPTDNTYWKISDNKCMSYTSTSSTTPDGSYDSESSCKAELDPDDHLYWKISDNKCMSYTSTSSTTPDGSYDSESACESSLTEDNYTYWKIVDDECVSEELQQSSAPAGYYDYETTCEDALDTSGDEEDNIWVIREGECTLDVSEEDEPQFDTEDECISYLKTVTSIKLFVIVLVVGVVIYIMFLGKGRRL